jgi:hypothetical protein
MITGVSVFSACLHNACYATLPIKKSLTVCGFGVYYRTMSESQIIMTVEQIVEQFTLSTAAVRRWIAAGLLEPVEREGRGRAGRMFFNRGAVASLLYGLCPVCGQGFRKATIKQRFCGRACRQKSNRAEKERQSRARPAPSAWARVNGKGSSAEGKKGRFHASA